MRCSAELFNTGQCPPGVYTLTLVASDLFTGMPTATTTLTARVEELVSTTLRLSVLTNLTSAKHARQLASVVRMTQQLQAQIGLRYLPQLSVDPREVRHLSLVTAAARQASAVSTRSSQQTGGVHVAASVANSNQDAAQQAKYFVMDMTLGLEVSYEPKLY